MVRVQERDRAVCRDVYEQQFLLMRDLMASHFGGVHRSEVYRRVQELERAGYLRRLQPFQGSQERLIRVTKKGEELARSLSSFEVPQLTRLNPATLMHDIVVNAVRYRLIDQIWDATWIPETVLKSRAGAKRDPDAAIGDGIVHFASGKLVVIEVENSLKGKDRYRRIFEAWGRREEVLFVLYVASEPSIARRLRSYLEELGNPDTPILVIELKDLLCEPPGKLWSVRGELDLLARRTF